jgi:hypothetical protein
MNTIRRKKRIRKLFLVSLFTAVVLSVSTYAWFIGLQTVAVSSFDVEIAVADSLALSLDGATWDTTIAISQVDLDDVSYEGHTNSWGGAGLIPMSSIGALDTGSSRMKLFEKASLTSTPGGFRLMASQVANTGATEQDGYVVFDLFVKNFSGTQYTAGLNILDEEAIYLTTDSEVTVSSAGTAGTGIENSVRVGFAQIGRVSGITTVADTITGITCTSAGEVTGICRTAQIWEPNDKAHEANAINWYNTICRARIDEDVTDPASYTATTCGAVANDAYVPTYAINAPITSANNVDVYDGAEYNTYTATTLLTKVSTFTDTMKDVAGVNRKEFMTLHPNSITKVRIYIWIEGQDVDNYDYAALGQAISVKFGFTKQKLTEDDFSYIEPTP